MLSACVPQEASPTGLVLSRDPKLALLRYLQPFQTWYHRMGQCDCTAFFKQVFAKLESLSGAGQLASTCSGMRCQFSESKPITLDGLVLGDISISNTSSKRL